MARFDATSILSGLHQRDAGSIRRVMNAVNTLMYDADADVVARFGLTGLERDIAVQIFQETKDNAVLHAGVTRFTSARRGDRQSILQAAREFSEVFVPSVFGPVLFRVQADVDAAQAALRNLVEHAPPFVFPMANYDAEDGNITDDSGSGSDSEETETESNPRKRKPTGSPEAKPENKRTKAYKGKLGVNNIPINIPKKPKGARIIEDGSIKADRVRKAVVGKFQLDLCRIDLKAEIERPVRSGNWVSIPDITHDRLSIHPDLSTSSTWNDEKAIKGLNTWRGQIFLRNFGKMRAARYPWIVQEQNKLFQLLRRWLAVPEIGWRWSQIPWQAIEDEFNDYFKDWEISTEDKTCPTAYEVTEKKDKQDTEGKKHTVVTISHKVKKAHMFVPRSWTGMQNQLEHFIHPTAKAIVAKAKKADADFEATNPKQKGKGKSKATSFLPNTGIKKGKGKEIANKQERDSDSELSDPPSDLEDPYLHDDSDVIVEDDRDETNIKLEHAEEQVLRDVMKESRGVIPPSLPNQNLGEDSDIIVEDDRDEFDLAMEEVEEAFLRDGLEISKKDPHSNDGDDMSGGGPSKQG